MSAALFSQLSLSVGSAQSSFTQRMNVAKPSVAPPRAAAPLVIEAAHKKGAGSTKNGRDSNAKRLGVKVYGDQRVKAGGIIIRQRGNTWHAGVNTFVGKDFTLHSKVEGTVKFKKTKRHGKQIDVIPLAAESA
mmetsp:Transcript_35655/g.42964  ORF Transcript_35655/g.42964 Transcript_35655/m.42964 type:complete len:133 (+) Transcript_35655:74-472(+)